MAKEHPDVLFAAVTQDKDEGDTICTAAGVESFPTIRFYAHGKKVGEVNGADPAACQRKIKALKSKMPPHPTYEESEEAYITEGECVVTPSSGEPVTIKKGDFVTFPKGMSCVWDVKEPMKKHYNMF